MYELTKVLRYIRIYGFGKTWFKIMGRARNRPGWFRPYRSGREYDVGVIGCGQFAFSTIGYSLTKHYGNRFVDCYDTDPVSKLSFSKFYRIIAPAETAEDLIENDNVRYVYVTSNHASHAEYAVQALAAGKVVYLEKPIAVSYEQLSSLVNEIGRTKRQVYAGYNRPYSGAIRDLRKHIVSREGPLTLNCFVSGHKIPDYHWYRNPEEGTRICGNVGHWLDLAVHILSWADLPDRWELRVTYSSASARDDDLCLSMASASGDLVSITLTSRCEPFEGINETINLQHGETICKIDDFRHMTVWQGKKLFRRRYWPKDVGHDLAIRQPFGMECVRDWNEVVKSTLLMLKFADMVKNGEERASFSFMYALAALPEISRESL